MFTFADICYSETIFVEERLCVHTTLSEAQIEIFPLPPKSGTWYFGVCFAEYEQDETKTWVSNQLPYFKIIPPITSIPIPPFLNRPPPPYWQIGHPNFSLLTKMQL